MINLSYVALVPEAMAQIATQTGIALSDFRKRHDDYLKHRDRLMHDPQAPLDAWGRLTRTAVKVALHASKGVPGAAPVVDLVGVDDAADAAEQVRAYLARKLSDSKDVRLLMNPIDELTPHFVRSLAHAGSQQPVALFFDSYERTAPILESWLLEVIEGRFGELPANLVVTIAGRDPLDAGRWSDYLDVIASIQLTSFSESEARRLLASKGVTEERVVETILSVSGRLPLLVALLAEGRPRDPEDVGDPSGTAVERFLKWEHNQQRRDAVLLSALPRRIDADILGVLTDTKDARALFSWLCALPFVTARGGRYEFHDVVRGPMIRIQRTQSPQRWRESHRRIAEAHHTWREALSSADDWLDSESVHHRSEETYHRLCSVPTEALADALTLAVGAAKAGPTVARRWAEMLLDAGRDANNAEVSRWGKRLLAAVGDQRQECSNFLTELLEDAPLTSLARVDALVERGRIYYSTDRESAALADLTEAIRTDPTISRAWEYRGEPSEVPASISVDAYLDTNDDAVGQRVLAAVDELAALLGYEGPVDGRLLDGSIWRRAQAALRGAPTSDEVQRRLIRIERALELVALDERQAEVDSVTMKAVEQLVSALSDVPQACIQVGSILLLKYEDASGPVLSVRNLSQAEIRALERFPEILTRPANALQALPIAVAGLESQHEQ